MTKPLTKSLFILGVLLIALNFISCTIVNNGTSIFCINAEILEVRVSGCEREPCIVKKGVDWPLEIDFTFPANENAKPASSILFRVFNPQFAPPPYPYGVNIADKKGCSELGLDNCPLSPNMTHTLKYNLLIHEKAVDVKTKLPTGQRNTQWNLWDVDNDSIGQFFCLFNVLIDIL